MATSFVSQNLQVHWQAGLELVKLLRRHRDLVCELTKRELTERYAGQMLGVLWAFVHPALQIGVYVFIFAFVFAVNIGGTAELPRDYTTYLLAGLIPWLMCAETLAKGTGVLVGNANLVKQVIFPLEVLPTKTVLASLFTQAVSLTLLLVYIGASSGGLPWTVVLLPLVVALQVLGLVGVALGLSVAGAFFRDLREFMQIVTLIGMYLIPVAYLPSMVPQMFRPVLYLNPFSYVVWCYQDVLYFGRIEHPLAWIVFPLVSLVSLVVGYRLFRLMKPLLGNVL